MVRQVDLKALVSHIVKGDGSDKCRICMGDTTEGQVYLGDTVMMDGDRHVTLAELLETITGVQVELSPELPDNICTACTESLAAAMPFLKLCKLSANTWREMIDRLENIKSSPSLKTLYVLIKDDETTLVGDTFYTPSKPVSSTEVYVNFKRKFQQMRYNKRRVEKKKLLSDGKSGLLLVCPECNIQLASEKKYNDHVKYLKLRWCRFCHDLVKLDELKHHLASHKIRVYQCNSCWVTFSHKEVLTRHIKRKHKSGNNFCNECNQSFTSASSLATHHVLQHESRICPGCDKKFTSISCYRYHVKGCYNNKNTENKYICDYCSKAHKTKNAVQIHINLTHLYGWKFQCQYCGRKFPSAARLQEHDNIHNKVLDRYVCEYCDAKISTRRGYQRHVQRHRISEEKVHPLNKTERKKSDLTYHCHICSKNYYSKNVLSRHFIKKHNVIVYNPKCS